MIYDVNSALFRSFLGQNGGSSSDRSVCKETLESMSELISDWQFERTIDQMSHLQQEDLYETLIQHTIIRDCEKALTMVNKKIDKNGKLQYLLELKARILWYKTTNDKVISNDLRDTFNSKGVFRFPMTYLVYGNSTHVKECSEYQLKIYRLGLEEAQKKNNKELLNEFELRIQHIEEAASRKLNKLNTKRKMKMEGEKQEEKKDQEVVKDVEEELPNAVDEMAEHNILKNKYEDEIFLDHIKQFDFLSKFTSLSKLGKNCYTGIEDTRKVEVEKSIIAATKRQVEGFAVLHRLCSQHHCLLTVESAYPHPTDGNDLIVCEVVHTLSDYLEKELQNLNREEMTKTQWWEHISKKFRIIFRDVIQGMIFLYMTSNYTCGDLSFNIFVTKSGRGKILPSMIERTIEEKEIIDHINQLKDAMKTVIAFPFDGITTNLELPTELKWFLDFQHSECFNPPWFVINCPFFWTVEERVHFVHELKMIFKRSAKTRWKIETWLENAGMFDYWQDVPDGVYEKILNYHQSRISNAEAEVESADAEVQALVDYYERVDICRFFVAVYTHFNDYVYKTDRRNKIFKRAEIEEALSAYFPNFYINMFECLCRNANELGDERLKMVSNLADASDFPRL